MSSSLRRRLLALAAGLGLALAGGILGGVTARTVSVHVPPHEGGKVFELALLLGALPIAFFVGVALHEGGHLLAAKLLGGRFALVIVGPLRIMRTPAGLKLGRNHRFSLLGGLALATPSSTDNLRRYLIGLLAGGPLASLLCGFILVGTAYLWAKHLPPGEVMRAGAFSVWALLGLTGLFSLAFFLASSLPSRAGGFASDGARLLALARQGPAAEREALVFTLTALSLSGVRARDLPADLVIKAAEPHGDPQVNAAMQLMAYLWALDQGRIDAARTYLYQSIEGIDRVAPFLRDSLYAELAYFKAFHERDAAGARASLNQAGSCELSEETRLRAEAAVLLVEQQPAAAVERANEAIAATARSLLGASARETIEWAEAIRTEASVRRGHPTTPLRPSPESG
ncbi:MAG TPA: hypothetical protein PKX00_00260 [Opitutaceae bacterium]|nr:hypothetical protein [Opitutaceae bacterium]